MVVKGIITSLDFNGNTCQVRMPIFETASGGEMAIAEAIISNTPGCYNGYLVGDVVLVAFENEHLENPVVIGKLYLGASEEAKSSRGAVFCKDLLTKDSGSLPLTTKISYEAPEGTVVAQGAAGSYKSLLDIINALQELTVSLNSTINNLTTRIEALEQEINN